MIRKTDLNPRIDVVNYALKKLRRLKCLRIVMLLYSNVLKFLDKNTYIFFFSLSLKY